MASSSSSSSGGSKKRDATAMAAAAPKANTNPTFLADVIRSSELSEATVEKRTKFIKSHLDEMSEEQLTRFEFFIRSHLTRSKVKDILTDCIPKKYVVTDEMSIASSGLAKLFVGELIETALDVLRERMALEGQWLQEASGIDAVETMEVSSSSGGLDQRLQVQHIQEAYRRMRCEGKVTLKCKESSATCPLTKNRLFHNVCSGRDYESLLLSSLQEQCSGIQLGQIPDTTNTDHDQDEEEQEEEEEAEEEKEENEEEEEEMVDKKNASQRKGHKKGREIS